MTFYSNVNLGVIIPGDYIIVDTNGIPKRVPAPLPALPITGGTLTGNLILNFDPTTNSSPFQAATKGYIDTSINALVSSSLPLTGGVLSGPLILNADPIATSPSFQAATKGYIDTKISNLTSSSIQLDTNGAVKNNISLNKNLINFYTKTSTLFGVTSTSPSTIGYVDSYSTPPGSVGPPTPVSYAGPQILYSGVPQHWLTDFYLDGNLSVTGQIKLGGISTTGFNSFTGPIVSSGINTFNGLNTFNSGVGADNITVTNKVDTKLLTLTGTSSSTALTNGASMIDARIIVNSETGSKSIGAGYFRADVSGSLITNAYPLVADLRSSAFRNPAGPTTSGGSSHVAFTKLAQRNLPTGVTLANFPAGTVMSDVWGDWNTLQDTTGLPSSIGRSLINEWDLVANNLDDLATRSGLSMILAEGTSLSNGGTPGSWATGIGIMNLSSKYSFGTFIRTGGTFSTASLDTRRAVPFTGKIIANSGPANTLRVDNAAGFWAGGWSSDDSLVSAANPATLLVNGNYYKLIGCVLDGPGLSSGLLTFTTNIAITDSVIGNVVSKLNTSIWMGIGQRIAFDYAGSINLVSDGSNLFVNTPNNGGLILPSDPTGLSNSKQAATKNYVDVKVATALPLSGGTLTDTLTALRGINLTGNLTFGANSLFLLNYNNPVGSTSAFTYSPTATGLAPGAHTLYYGADMRWETPNFWLDGNIYVANSSVFKGNSSFNGIMTIGVPTNYQGQVTISPVSYFAVPGSTNIVQNENYMVVAGSGGVSGNVTSNVKIETNVVGKPEFYAYGLISTINYNPTFTGTDTTGGAGQHVGGYLQAIRSSYFSTGDSTRNPGVWGATIESRDNTGQPSSKTGAQLGVEIDINGNDLDNANNGQGVRQAVSIISYAANTNGRPYEVGNLIGMYVNSATPNNSAKRFLYAGGLFTQSVLDMRGAIEGGLPWAPNSNVSIYQTVVLPNGYTIRYTSISGVTGAIAPTSNTVGAIIADGTATATVLGLSCALWLADNQHIALSTDGKNSIKWDSKLNTIRFDSIAVYMPGTVTLGTGYFGVGGINSSGPIKNSAGIITSSGVFTAPYTNKLNITQLESDMSIDMTNPGKNLVGIGGQVWTHGLDTGIAYQGIQSGCSRLWVTCAGPAGTTPPPQEGYYTYVRRDRPDDPATITAAGPNFVQPSVWGTWSEIECYVNLQSSRSGGVTHEFDCTRNGIDDANICLGAAVNLSSTITGAQGGFPAEFTTALQLYAEQNNSTVVKRMLSITGNYSAAGIDMRLCTPLGGSTVLTSLTTTSNTLRVSNIQNFTSSMYGYNLSEPVGSDTNHQRPVFINGKPNFITGFAFDAKVGNTQPSSGTITLLNSVAIADGQAGNIVTTNPNSIWLADNSRIALNKSASVLLSHSGNNAVFTTPNGALQVDKLTFGNSGTNIFISNDANGILQINGPTSVAGNITASGGIGAYGATPPASPPNISGSLSGGNRDQIILAIFNLMKASGLCTGTVTP